MKVKNKKRMNRVVSALLFITLISAFNSCRYTKTTEPEITDTQTSVPVFSPDTSAARGEYLVGIMGCTDCHSPKKINEAGIPYPDPERLFSGHPAQLEVPEYDPEIIKDWVLFNGHNTAAVGPWGVSFAANITSDATGIGTWSEEQFFNAMRHGKYKGLDGSRTLLPPMPWPNYTTMTDEDLRAVFNFLKSTKPVENVVPAAIIAVHE